MLNLEIMKTIRILSGTVRIDPFVVLERIVVVFPHHTERCAYGRIVFQQLLINSLSHSNYTFRHEETSIARETGEHRFEERRPGFSPARRFVSHD